MDGLMAEPVPGLERRWDKVSRFGRADLEALRKRPDQPLPDHPFFDRCDELLALDRQLVAGLDGACLALEYDFIDYARREIARRKRERHALFFDDLLLGLRDALAGEAGDALAGALRGRHPVALIDEFQDTDPIQYEIFRRVWHRDGGREGVGPEDPLLCLIGDPKQAIYAFRGADVLAYLDAQRDAGDDVHSLDRNYRSDPGLVEALNAAFGAHPNPFANERIRFEPIEPALARDRLAGDGIRSGLRVLFVGREPGGRSLVAGGLRPSLERSIASEVARLLASDLRIDDRPLAPGDVAVLTRTNAQARDVQTALREQGIVSVLQSEESVFGTDEAAELERVMRAMAEPEDPARVRAAIATTLLSTGADDLPGLAADDGESLASESWESWCAGFRDARRAWIHQGFVQALRLLWTGRAVGVRLLTRSDGERRVTNLLHLAELLQQAALEGRFGPLALIHWFSRRRRGAREPGRFAGEEAQLRLESDAEAVQLVTVHRSKGLQYPITLCPFLWDGTLLRRSALRVFHDPVTSRLTLDLRPGGSFDGGDESEDEFEETATSESERLASQEIFAENMRLLYVALTRARHHCSLVWGAFRKAGTSPLGQLLDPAPEAPGHGGDLSLPEPKRFDARTDDEMLEALERLAEAAGGTITIQPLDRTAGPAAVSLRGRSPGEAAALVSRHARRRFSGAWRVSSFSGLIASAPDEEGHAAGVRIDPESEEGRDYDARLAGEAAPDARSERLPAEERIRLADFPAGVVPGILIHEIFERIDFEAATSPAPDLACELDAVVADRLARRGLGAQWRQPLADAVRDVLEVPLDPAEQGSRLGRLSRRDRIDEMAFMLPVAAARTGEGGERLTPAALARVFERHATSALTRRYGERAARLGFPALEGYLRGFVDLVFRREGRFHVVDYKSNWLGASPDDYEPEALARSMLEHDYVLQYHLYLVALHRHLRQRLPRYDYDRHVGGACYLFVRGMSPLHPAGRGVFHDRPPRALIEALEELLA